MKSNREPILMGIWFALTVYFIVGFIFYMRLRVEIRENNTATQEKLMLILEAEAETIKTRIKQNSHE